MRPSASSASGSGNASSTAGSSTAASAAGSSLAPSPASPASAAGSTVSAVSGSEAGICCRAASSSACRRADSSAICAFRLSMVPSNSAFCFSAARRASCASCPACSASILVAASASSFAAKSVVRPSNLAVCSCTRVDRAADSVLAPDASVRAAASASFALANSVFAVWIAASTFWRTSGSAAASFRDSGASPSTPAAVPACTSAALNPDAFSDCCMNRNPKAPAPISRTTTNTQATMLIAFIGISLCKRFLSLDWSACHPDCQEQEAFKPGIGGPKTDSGSLRRRDRRRCRPRKNPPELVFRPTAVLGN